MPSLNKPLVAIIVPAYNEQPVIATTLNNLKSKLKTYSSYRFKIIVINDGSTDKTLTQLKNLSDITISHKYNQGLGAALATGLEFVKRHQDFDLAITFDSDGQHQPKDILPCLKALTNHDMVIGSRFLNSTNQIPMFRRFILSLSNVLTFIFFGIWTTDSQSGFRGFNRKAIEAINLSTNRMEVSSEFFSEIKLKKLTFCEIPIKVIYTPYSLSKGQSNLNGLQVFLKLVYKLFR